MKALRTSFLCLALPLAVVASAQDVVNLYPDNASAGAQPSSTEKEYYSTAWGTEVVTNVNRPTLTVFRPSPDVKNGAAIVICPGGGFMALSITSEGTDVARYLAARGMTAFVLRYRLAHTDGDATQQFATLYQDKEKFAAMMKVVAPQSVADGLAAVTYVRSHASDYGILADRVGIIGFSAGGMVTAEVAYRYTPEGRPAFVAPIYSGGPPKDIAVPSDAPPMFIAAATDDSLGLAPRSVDLYQSWTGAHKSAELHLYAKGGHGFGMHINHIPTDQWIDRFAEWLTMEGFIKK